MFLPHYLQHEHESSHIHPSTTRSRRTRYEGRACTVLVVVRVTVLLLPLFLSLAFKVLCLLHTMVHYYLLYCGHACLFPFAKKSNVQYMRRVTFIMLTSVRCCLLLNVPAVVYTVHSDAALSYNFTVRLVPDLRHTRVTTIGSYRRRLLMRLLY